MNKKIYLNILVAAVILITASACSNAQGALEVKDSWARPGLVGGNTGVFFTIYNGSGSEDQLLSAASDVAAFVEIHKTVMENDVMMMKPQSSVSIPPGDEVIFKPGDLHVMLIDLNSDLKVGDEFQVSLEFENAGEIQLNVMVREP